jgi:hypothetical protein
MEEQQIGWIAAIIIGGIAGWLAEQFSPVMCRGWMANFGKRLAAARTRLS